MLKNLVVNGSFLYNGIRFSAAMAELVDALDSGSSRGNSVDVRVILAANSFSTPLILAQIHRP